MKSAGNARSRALEALNEWENGNLYAQEIFEELAARDQLPSNDHGLAKELLFGILRNRSYLDHIISILRKRGAIKPRVRNLLRLGLYQIFNTNIADHAAVNETVSLSKKHERGLVNAILRNAIRQRDSILDEIENTPPEIRLSHPKFLINRWTKFFGEETTDALCLWNNEPPPVYARIHDEAAFHEQSAEDEFEAVKAFPEFIKLPPGVPPKALIDKGIIYIQDPSTSLPCWLLAPMPGETILDACAAPGGKTALLSAMSPDDTQIIATDSNPTRLDRLRENIERLQLDNITICEVDWAKPKAAQVRDLPKFDAILLDVPCSNSGVMRRRVDVRWRLRPKDFEELAALQLKILKNAIPYLKPGGRIVYSTCSIDPEENRDLVENCGLDIVEIRESLPWRDGFDGAFVALLKVKEN